MVFYRYHFPTFILGYINLGTFKCKKYQIAVLIVCEIFGITGFITCSFQSHGPRSPFLSIFFFDYFEELEDEKNEQHYVDSLGASALFDEAETIVDLICNKLES